ncbi:unnamed protein product, partial [Rotaria magnacalcarata]
MNSSTPTLPEKPSMSKNFLHESASSDALRLKALQLGFETTSFHFEISCDNDPPSSSEKDFHNKTIAEFRTINNGLIFNETDWKRVAAMAEENTNVESIVDSIDPLSDRILDQFCLQILPAIHQNIKWLNLESSSMKRILLATNYPNLYGLGLYDIEIETALSFFSDESCLTSIDKNQILEFVIKHTRYGK